MLNERDRAAQNAQMTSTLATRKIISRLSPNVLTDSLNYSLIRVTHFQKFVTNRVVVTVVILDQNS